MDKYKDLGFEPIQEASANDHSDLGFEPLPNTPQISSLESGLRGAAQGATFGFEDELAGALGLGKDIVTGQTKYGQFLDAYRKHRDNERLANEQAQEANPLTYEGSNIAGSILPAILTGGTTAEATAGARLGEAALTGLKAGTAYGAGTSEADLTKGDVGNLALDTAKGGAAGAILGGAFQGGLEATKAGLAGLGATGKALKDTNTVQHFLESLNYGKKGTNLVTSKAREDLENKLTSLGSETGFAAKHGLEKAGKNYGEVLKNLKESGKSENISSYITELRKVQDDLLNSQYPEDIDSGKKLKNTLDSFTLGGEKEIPIQHSKFTPGKLISSKPSSQDILEQEAIKAKASAKALGQNLNTEIIPTTDVQGNKLLTLLKSTNEQTGASERAIPIKDENGNIISTVLDEGDLASNSKNSATAKTIFDKPEITGGFTSSEKGPLVTEMQKMRLGGTNSEAAPFEEALKLKRKLNELTGVNGSNPKLETDDAINPVKDITTRLNRQLKEVPEFTDVNKQYAASKQVFDYLGIQPSDFETDAGTGKLRLKPLAEDKIRDKIRQYASETASHIKASDKLDNAMRLLSITDPDKAQALSPIIEDTSKAYNLATKAQQFGFFNKSTFLKSGSIQVGNRLGLGIKKISDATPDHLKQIAQDLINQGTGKTMGLAMKIKEAMTKTDPVAKNAVLFSIQQNPEYRKMLNTYTTEENK